MAANDQGGHPDIKLQSAAVLIVYEEKTVIRALERATLTLIGLAVLCSAAAILTRGMSFNWSGAVVPLGTLLLLGALALVYRTARDELGVTTLAFAMFSVLAASLCVGVGTLAALGWKFALVDDVLVRADALLGFDAAAIIRLVAAYPFAAVGLYWVYIASVGAIIVTMIILCLLRAHVRVAESAFLYVATIILCALVHFSIPAAGAFLHGGFGTAQVGALPEGAGVYHVTAFMGYRDGAFVEISLSRLMGVITFPSFHTCMALIAILAFRGMGWWFVGSIFFNLVVILSVVPIGGHYVVDIFAGALVVAVCFVGAQWIESAARRGPALAVAPDYGQSFSG